LENIMVIAMTPYQKDDTKYLYEKQMKLLNFSRVRHHRESGVVMVMVMVVSGHTTASSDSAGAPFLTH
jgi:hypothetical protein